MVSYAEPIPREEGIVPPPVLRTCGIAGFIVWKHCCDFSVMSMLKVKENRLERWSGAHTAEGWVKKMGKTSCCHSD